MKFATRVMAVTSLIVSGILVAAAVSIPVTAQKSSDSLIGDDVTSSLQSAKNAFERSYEEHKDGQFAGSINANKYDSSSDNVGRIKIECYYYMQ